MTSEDQLKPIFVQELRNALAHLYDPGNLRQSLLVKLFNLEKEMDAASALRNNLAKAIDANRPKADVPKDANIWRLYYILYYRFIEQSSQNEVADDLALSIRQLRRQEKVALELLANYLWASKQLANHPQLISILQPQESKTELTRKTPSLSQELDWLVKQSPVEHVFLDEVLRDILTILEPVFKEQNIQTHLYLQDLLPAIDVKPAALRQALISLLTMAAYACRGSPLQIRAEALKHGFDQIVVSGKRATPYPAVEQLHSRDLEVAIRLFQVCQGTLEIEENDQAGSIYRALITLPNREKILILILDDNEDTLGLIKRYLSNTRYQFIGTTKSEQFLRMCEEESPDLVILDVMLPGIDGWEVLGRIREHPKMSGVPIVVSTILPQEQLALTLGATSFINKPFSQKALLSLLDRQVGLEARRPR